MGADYYEVLQITPVATFDQVHKAYRALAMQYHPDRTRSRLYDGGNQRGLHGSE